MSSAEKSIDLNVPVRTAYNQWTQFEDFPRFMEGVEEIRQLDDRHLHWRVNIAGKEEEFDVEITEQTPDQRIAWRSTTGPANAGVATFHRISDDRSRVTLQMEYEPDGVLEKVADAVGLIESRLEGDLERFKAFVEERGTETGAWRGKV